MKKQKIPSKNVKEKSNKHLKNEKKNEKRRNGARSGGGFFDSLIGIFSPGGSATVDVELLPIYRTLNDNFVWDLTQPYKGGSFLRVDKSKSGDFIAKRNDRDRLTLWEASPDSFAPTVNKENEKVYPFHPDKHEFMKCPQKFELFIEVPLIYLSDKSKCKSSSYRVVSVVSTRVHMLEQVQMYSKYGRFGENLDAKEVTINVDGEERKVMQLVDKNSEDAIKKRFNIKQDMYYVFLEDVLNLVSQQYSDHFNKENSDDVLAPLLMDSKCQLEGNEFQLLEKFLSDKLANTTKQMLRKKEENLALNNQVKSIIDSNNNVYKGTMPIFDIFLEKNIKVTYGELLKSSGHNMFDKFEIYDNALQKRNSLYSVTVTNQTVEDFLKKNSAPGNKTLLKLGVTTKPNKNYKVFMRLEVI